VSTVVFNPGPTNAEIALACARSGLSVIPWRFVGKRKVPHVTGWPALATRDEDQIAEWWGYDFPRALVGVVTGEEYDLWVLDVDTGDGHNGVDGEATLRELERVNGPLPRTFTVRTAGGGRHLYLRWPTDDRVIGTSSNVAGPGLDTRGRIGFVVAPGTSVNVNIGPLRTCKVLTESGAREVRGYRDQGLAHYEVVVDGVEPAYAPDWLVDLCARTSTPCASSVVLTETRAEALLESVALKLTETRSGRNDQLNRAAWTLATSAAVTRSDAYHALRDACVTNGLYADDGVNQFEATFESGWSKGELSEVAPDNRVLRALLSGALR
jgi:hypothetical protein